MVKWVRKSMFSDLEKDLKTVNVSDLAVAKLDQTWKVHI